MNQMMRLSNKIVKISIKPLNFNRFNNISRTFSNINDTNDDKKLHGTVKGISGLIFTFRTLFKIITDEKELNYGIKLFKDGLVDRYTNIFKLLINLQHPLILKYKFDIYEFYNGSKSAIENILEAPYNEELNYIEYLKSNCFPHIADRLFERKDLIKDKPRVYFTLSKYNIKSITTSIARHNQSGDKRVNDLVESKIAETNDDDSKDEYKSLLNEYYENSKWLKGNFPENSACTLVNVTAILEARSSKTDPVYLTSNLSAQFMGCLSKVDGIEWKIVELEF